MTNDKISRQELQRLVKLIAGGNENLWYNTDPWRSKRLEVLQMDRFECQICKSRGRYQKAVVVHHVMHLKDRPDLALSIYDPDTGARQLISLCKKCHEDQHPESKRQFAVRPQFTTPERWD